MGESLNRNSDQFVNVEKVFYEKNPSLARIMPGFFFRFIERIVHQDEINYIISHNNHLNGLPFVNAILDYFKINLVIKGTLLPNDGSRYVFASNHPLGGMEGVALTKILAENYGDVRVPVNDILLKINNFAPYFIPLNKHGSNSKEAVIELDKNFESEFQVLMFPAGYVSRKNSGVIKDTEWKKTFISKAIKHKRDVIPVFVNGENSKFFYRLGVIRNFLGIKANLEMFFLPDEMFKQRNKSITIIFGKPIPYSYFEKLYKQQEWADKLREYVYKLKDNHSLEFDDFIKHSS